MLRSLMLLNECQCYDVRKWAEFEKEGLEPKAFLEEGAPLWEKIKISERCQGVISKLAASGWAEREIERCEKLGVRLVTCRDAIYPPSLLELQDAPLVLYLWGERIALQNPSVGVVGTRRCSAYGMRISRELGGKAALLGWGVVSGGAKGIDGAAHGGCLEAGGITAAVLGTGVDVVYPAEHRDMFQKIRAAGMLVSEYSLGTKGEAWRFPRRNRIIAGMSSRTVVVEAPRRSGAMITARQAAEAGREVWAVPGKIDDERCAGSNRLIFDGAFPLTDMETFFGTFGTTDAQKKLFDDMGDAARIPPKEAPILDECEKTLIALLANQGDRTVDILASEAKMSAAEVFKKLSMMSMRGLVRSSCPGRYRLSDD